MPFNKLGRVLFLLGLGGLGLLSLIYRDFALGWQPVPDWVTPRALLACISGAILFAGGAAICHRKTAACGALVLTLFVLSWLLFLQVPRVVASPLNAGAWLGFAENAVLVAGGWTVFLTLATTSGWPKWAATGGIVSWRAGRFLFAVSLPIIGFSHFVYVDATAAMVPAWLHFRVGLAYLTGAGHMAAGIGILFSLYPRLAATLEATMISLFVLLLHLPGVCAAPSDRVQWTMLSVATALAGAAWAVAGSLEVLPWGRSRQTAPR